MDSTSEAWLRIGGELPPVAELTHLLGVEPSSSSRKGDTTLGGRIRQTVDVWVLDLTEQWHGAMPATLQAQVAAILRRLAPGLRALDPAHCQTEVNISTTLNDLPTFTLHLSSEVLAALAAGNLTFGVAITLVDLDDSADTDRGTPDERGPDAPTEPTASVTVRLWGELPSLDEVSHLLGNPRSGAAPGRALPPGAEGDEQAPGWEVPLTGEVQWDAGGFLARANWIEATQTLRRLAPGLRALRQAGCATTLHITFTCVHFSDGFSLPAPLIVAAGAAGLAFDLLVLRADEQPDGDDSPIDESDLDDPEYIADVQQSIDESASNWWK